MSFATYLWELLTKPLRKSLSEIQRWINVLGAALDEARQMVFNVRRAWFIETATGPALDLHGKDRGLPRYPGETDDTYRRRLQAAYHTYVSGGTNPGLSDALRVLGYPTRVEELFKEDPLRWDEFRVVSNADINQPLTSTQISVIQQIIDRSRAAHAKLAALIMATGASAQAMSYLVTITLILNGTIKAPPGQIFLDGTQKLDGTWSLNTSRISGTVTPVI